MLWKNFIAWNSYLLYIFHNNHFISKQWIFSFLGEFLQFAILSMLHATNNLPFVSFAESLLEMCNNIQARHIHIPSSRTSCNVIVCTWMCGSRTLAAHINGKWCPITSNRKLQMGKWLVSLSLSFRLSVASSHFSPSTVINAICRYSHLPSPWTTSLPTPTP